MPTRFLIVICTLVPLFSFASVDCNLGSFLQVLPEEDLIKLPEKECSTIPSSNVCACYSPAITIEDKAIKEFKKNFNNKAEQYLKNKLEVLLKGISLSMQNLAFYNLSDDDKQEILNACSPARLDECKNSKTIKEALKQDKAQTLSLNSNKSDDKCDVTYAHINMINFILKNSKLGVEAIKNKELTIKEELVNSCNSIYEGIKAVGCEKKVTLSLPKNGKLFLDIYGDEDLDPIEYYPYCHIVQKNHTENDVLELFENKIKKSLEGLNLKDISGGNNFSDFQDEYYEKRKNFLCEEGRPTKSLAEIEEKGCIINRDFENNDDQCKILIADYLINLKDKEELEKLKLGENQSLVSFVQEAKRNKESNRDDILISYLNLKKREKKNYKLEGDNLSKEKKYNIAVKESKSSKQKVHETYQPTQQREEIPTQAQGYKHEQLPVHVPNNKQAFTQQAPIKQDIQPSSTQATNQPPQQPSKLEQELFKKLIGQQNLSQEVAKEIINNYKEEIEKLERKIEKLNEPVKPYENNTNNKILPTEGYNKKIDSALDKFAGRMVNEYQAKISIPQAGNIQKNIVKVIPLNELNEELIKNPEIIVVDEKDPKFKVRVTSKDDGIYEFEKLYKGKKQEYEDFYISVVKKYYPDSEKDISLLLKLLKD